MAEPDHSSPSTSSASSINRDSSASASAAAPSSSNSSSVREEEEGNHNHRFPHPEPEQPHTGISYTGNILAADDDSSIIRDDTWSCVIVVLTFWFFVSMTLILGVYGPANIKLGPNSSLLIQPNPLFVQTLKVQEIDEIKSGPKLYGFYKSPPLDVVNTWTEGYFVSVQADSHKEYIQFLNEGSQMNISYTIKSPSSSLFLIIAEGNEGLTQWLEDPTYPNTTLSWNIIHGSGMIHQDIFTSSSYYVALGNLNSEEVEVQLNFSVKAFVYNTSKAYYKCTFTDGSCDMSILFPEGNAIVLTTPSPDQGVEDDDWYVRVSYGPRWLTYVTGIVGMSVLMMVAFNFLNKFRYTREDGTGVQYGDMESARAPLLSYKDDDLSSWGSSYDSVSNDERDLEDFLATNSLEGKSLRDGENGNTRRLCAICFDAPRDCFFLPCGHCVACFECGTRIAEADGICPICRRTMKKVRKIFTV